jgi:predicted RNase H-like HicB family nuclease
LGFQEAPSVQREFSIIIERDEEGFYVASVPELRGCHTQAKSLDTLMKRTREAIDLCLEVEGGSALLEAVEFVHQNVAGVDLFLDGPPGSVRSAGHVLFAEERSRSRFRRHGTGGIATPRLGAYLPSFASP